jgi:hypothetical protein
MQVLLATAYHPPAGYMAEAVRSDGIVVEAFETYTKQTCRNHCIIFGPNGRQTLSIPVIKVNGNHTLTRDVLISGHQPWQKIHWRSIETAYNNSPFFLYYQDDFARFYEKKFRFLLDLNTEILTILLRMLKSPRPVTHTAEFEKNPAGIMDLRKVQGIKHHGPLPDHPHYTQVFESRHGFIPGLSILDVIFNLGPEARGYLDNLK